MPILYTDQDNKTGPPGTQDSQLVPPVDEGSAMPPLTSFARHPSGIHFETQENDENVELFLRQHPLVNVGWIMVTLILLATPYFIWPFFWKIVGVNLVLPQGYLVIGTIFWYIATFGFVLSNFIHWFFNIYVVTNERIVDIDFYYLLYKHFSEAELNKIQDISYTSSGIMPTVFNYGNVTVQTASEMPNLEFDMVPYPEKVVETIRMLIERLEKKS